MLLFCLGVYVGIGIAVMVPACFLSVLGNSPGMLLFSLTSPVLWPFVLVGLCR